MRYLPTSCYQGSWSELSASQHAAAGPGACCMQPDAGHPPPLSPHARPPIPLCGRMIRLTASVSCPLGAGRGELFAVLHTGRRNLKSCEGLHPIYWVCARMKRATVEDDVRHSIGWLALNAAWSCPFSVLFFKETCWVLTVLQRTPASTTQTVKKIQM